MTAVQELIDWAISLQYNQQQCIDWIVIKDKAESLLEMEKQQIINAWKDRNQDVIKSDGKTSEQYYTSTYGSKGSDDHISDISKMVELPQQEISDEEIEKAAKNHHNYYEWSAGAKWYREQLKQKL
jgi:hypothetical protein